MVTGPKPPGQNGLNGELARLDKKIDEGIRGIRTTHIPDHTYGPAQAHICHVDLQGDVFMPSNTTAYPTVQWNPVAYVDTMGCYRYAKAFGTYWELPWTGHYSVHVHSRFAANASYDPYLPNWVSTNILVNQYTPNGFSIAESSCYLLSPAAGMYYDTYADHMHFAAGDRILVGFYCLYAATLIVRTAGTNAYTGITIRYLGELS